MSRVFSPVRALVVDDHDEFREFAVAVLRRAGLDVTSAATGATAIYAARVLVPNLVLLDVTLPGLSGYSVVRQLRRDPALASLAIVVASSVSPELLDYAVSVGADLALHKPCTPEELEGAVERVLQLRRTSWSAEEPHP